MKKDKNYNIKLGVFVTVGIILLITGIYMLGRQENLFGSNFRITAIFKDVKGLQVGSNVRFSGINVGVVNDIVIISDSTVEVQMSIREDVNEFIKKDSRAVIGTEGLLGNKMIKILPGKETTPVVKENDRIPTLTTVEIDDILQEVQTSSENISEVSKNLIDITAKINRGEGVFGKLFTDTTLTKNLDKASKNIYNMTGELASISYKINQGKGILGKLLTDTSFANYLAGSGENFRGASKNLEEITRKINKGEGVFGRIFTDTSFSGDLKVMADNLTIASKNTKKVSDNLVELSKGLEQQSGLVGRLILDSAFADSITMTLQNVNKGINEVSEAADAIEKAWIIRMFSKDKKKKKKTKGGE
jgi:phospholipid/cholesterol/gamma-HCH transport system substrate-binding protein